MQTIRLLFWLKIRLALREYRRSASAAIGALVLLLFFLPISLAIAGVSAHALHNLYPPHNEDLLRAILLGVYGLWLVAPLLGYNLNDSYDITRLFVYPLSLRQILTGAILGSVVDVPTLLLLPTLIGILYGFGTSAVAIMCTICAMVLFLFQTLALSQAVLMLTSGVLRTRRFRDALAILLPALGILYYLITQALVRQSFHVNISALLESRVWNAIDYLPPGFAARAAIEVHNGHLLASAANLACLAVITIGTVYIVSMLLQRVYAGDNVGGGRESAAQPARRVNAEFATSESRFPAAVAAVFAKERKYLARDPFFRMLLGNLVYMLVVAVFVFVNPMRANGTVSRGPAAVFASTLFLLLTPMQVMGNIFGTEGAAAPTLFLFPCARRHIIIGKNLAHFSALSAINLISCVILATVSHSVAYLPLLFYWMELASLVCIAVGNVVSIYVPVRLVLRGWRLRQQSSSHRFGQMFLNIGIMLGAGILYAPILLALLAPALAWIPRAWLAVTVPAGLIYACSLYALSVTIAGPLLERREQVVVARLSRDSAG